MVRDVLFAIKDIPNANFEIKVIAHLVEKDPKRIPSYYDISYSEVTKISIINGNMLEIVQDFHDQYPEIKYIKLESIEWYKIMIVGATDEDDDIIEKALGGNCYD